MNTPSKLRSLSSSSNKILDLPDLSYLSENERKIIEAVIERQKLEEENNLNIITKSKQQQQQQQHEKFNKKNSLESSNYDLKSQQSTPLKVKKQQKIAITQSITDIAQEVKQKYGYNKIDTGDICDICKKTKFVNINAHQCVYCKLKCCIRCSFRLKTKTKELWTCSQCKLKQDAILKSNQWLANNHSASLGKSTYASDYLINRTTKSKKQTKSTTITTKTTTTINNNHNENSNDKSIGIYTQGSFDSNNSNNDDDLSRYNNSQLKRNLTISGDNYNDYIMQKEINSKDIFNEKTNEIEAPIKQLTSSSSSSLFLRNKQQQQQQEKEQEQEQLSITLNNYLTKQNSLDIDDDNNLSPIKIISPKKSSIEDNNMLKMTLIRSNLNSNNDNNNNLSIDTESKLLNRLLLQKQYSSSSSSLTQTSADSKQLSQQQQQQQQQHADKISKLDNDISKNNKFNYQNSHHLLHTDSLSSDPSDSVSQRNSICLSASNTLNIVNIKPNDNGDSGPKRVITNSSINTNTTSTSILKPPSVTSSTTSHQHQQQQQQQQSNIITRMKNAKIKANKQHSLSSSDEYDEYEDVDEEIRSTTEYTTNDEMDLDSEKSTYLRKLNNPDNNKNNILAAKMNKFLSPITWKISTDRQHLIGHLTFKKNLNDPNASQSLGLKVIGRETMNELLGAIIEQIKKGSPCDIIYHLKAGDEIIEWNQINIRNKPHDQVLELMSKSRYEPQVDITVERSLNFKKINIVNNTEQNKNFKENKNCLSSG